jgi:hypothetical protein
MRPEVAIRSSWISASVRSGAFSSLPERPPLIASRSLEVQSPKISPPISCYLHSRAQRCQTALPSPVFSISCKRVRNILKTSTFKSLCFHTHAHSFAASPVLSTTSQKHTGGTHPLDYASPNVPLELIQLSSYASIIYKEPAETIVPAAGHGIFRRKRNGAQQVAGSLATHHWLQATSAQRWARYTRHRGARGRWPGATGGR